MFKSAAFGFLALSLAGLALAPGFVAAGEDHHQIKPRHARRATVRSPVAAMQNRTVHGPMNKRAEHTGVRATWYDVLTGLGSCGVQSQPEEFTIALNEGEFGSGYPGPRCFQYVDITYQGKRVSAQIRDTCPSEFCPGFGMIDMSKGLFQALSDLGAGVIYVDWDFQGAGGPPPEPTPTTSERPVEPTTSTTSTQPTPEPTSTTSSEARATTSSSSVASTTSLSSVASSSSQASSSLSSAAFTSNSLSAAVGSPTSGLTGGKSVTQTGNSGENIDKLFQLAVQLGSLVGGAAQAKSGLGRREL